MGGDTCIVDHDVHSAPFMDQAVFELLQVSDLGDITALVKRLDAQILQFGQRLLAPLVVDIGNGDFPAGPGETQSESLAEAAGAPGNGNALVGKTFHGEFLLFLFYSPLPTGERSWGRGPGVHMQDRTLRAVRALAPSPCISLPARPAQEGEGNNGQPFFNFSYFFSSNLAIRPRCTSSGPSAMRSTRA